MRDGIAVVAGAADQAAIDREQAEALHQEIDRLPPSSRLPVVLCYLEGLSLSEAARRLRCPAGTVHSRLARARTRLRQSLARRGVALSAGALAAVLVPRCASASVSSLLSDSTAGAATAFATGRGIAGGGLSAGAVAVAREVLHAILIRRLRSLSVTLLACAVIASGAGFLARSLARGGFREKTERRFGEYAPANDRLGESSGECRNSRAGPHDDDRPRRSTRRQARRRRAG